MRQGNLRSRSDGHYRSASIGVRGRLPPAEQSHNPTFGPSPISDGVELCVARGRFWLRGTVSSLCTTGQEPARGGAVLRRSRGPTRRCEAERAPGTPLGLSTAWRGRVWRVARRVAPPGARRSGRRGRALEAGVKAPAAALRCAAGGDGSLLVSCSGACSGRCVRCVAARLRAGRSVVRRSGRAGCGRLCGAGCVSCGHAAPAPCARPRRGGHRCRMCAGYMPAPHRARAVCPSRPTRSLTQPNLPRSRCCLLVLLALPALAGALSRQ